jgi:hypothetical protein
MAIHILLCSDLDFCCNIAQHFATNDKFMSTEHICGNTIKYIATILSFMTIAVGSCNQSQYYSNNKKFVAENLFLATNLVDYGNKNFMWQYYSYMVTIYKFGGSNTYLL